MAFKPGRKVRNNGSNLEGIVAQKGDKFVVEFCDYADGKIISGQTPEFTAEELSLYFKACIKWKYNMLRYEENK